MLYQNNETLNNDQNVLCKYYFINMIVKIEKNIYIALLF